MGQLHEHIGELRSRLDALKVAVSAEIAEDAVAVNQPVSVTIEAFDGGVQRFGPCPWPTRVADDGSVVYPSRGDRALVIEDLDGQPWIQVWWPYDL